MGDLAGFGDIIDVPKVFVVDPKLLRKSHAALRELERYQADVALFNEGAVKFINEMEGVLRSQGVYHFNLLQGKMHTLGLMPSSDALSFIQSFVRGEFLRRTFCGNDRSENLALLENPSDLLRLLRNVVRFAALDVPEPHSVHSGSDGGRYKVMRLVTHTETGELFVTYKRDDDDPDSARWALPLEAFCKEGPKAGEERFCLMQDNTLVGRIFKHYKGREYLVLSVVTHAKTCELLVTYKAVSEYQHRWARPLEMFCGEVIVDGMMQSCFARVVSHDAP